MENKRRSVNLKQSLPLQLLSSSFLDTSQILYVSLIVEVQHNIMMASCILDVTFLVGQEVKELSGIIFNNGIVQERFHYIFKSQDHRQDSSHLEFIQAQYASRRIHGLAATDGSEPTDTLKNTIQRIAQCTSYCFMKGTEKCAVIQKYFPESYPPIIDFESLGCESFKILLKPHHLSYACVTHSTKNEFYHKSCSLVKLQILFEWATNNINKLNMLIPKNRRLTFGEVKMNVDSNKLAFMGFIRQVGNKTSLFCVYCRFWTKISSFEQHDCNCNC